MTASREIVTVELWTEECALLQLAAEVGRHPVLAALWVAHAVKLSAFAEVRGLTIMEAAVVLDAEARVILGLPEADLLSEPDPLPVPSPRRAWWRPRWWRRQEDD